MTSDNGAITAGDGGMTCQSVVIEVLPRYRALETVWRHLSELGKSQSDDECSYARWI